MKNKSSKRTKELIERLFEVTARSTTQCNEILKKWKVENRLKENPSLSQTASTEPQLLIIKWKDWKEMDKNNTEL